MSFEFIKQLDGHFGTVHFETEINETAEQDLFNLDLLTVLVIDQLDQSVDFVDINFLVLIDHLVGYLLTGNVLVVVFLKHHVLISLLSDSLDQSGVAKHIRLEIVFTGDFVQIVYSLIEFIDPDIKVKDSVIADEVDFDIIVLHLLEQQMGLVNQLLVFFFFLIAHAHVDQLLQHDIVSDVIHTHFAFSLDFLKQLFSVVELALFDTDIHESVESGDIWLQILVFHFIQDLLWIKVLSGVHRVSQVLVVLEQPVIFPVIIRLVILLLGFLHNRLTGLDFLKDVVAN